MASSQDKFRKTAGVPATTLASAIYASDDVITFASTADWPTDTGIDIMIDRIDQNGNPTPEKKEVLTIVVNENTGVQAIRGVNGNACAHDAGAIVEPSVVSAKNHNDMIDGILNLHKQDGTLKDAAVKAQNIDFAQVYPIGSVLAFYDDVDHSNHLGLTWELFAQGRTLVGKSTETEFNEIGKTGGAKTHTLNVNQIPSHDHGLGTHAWDVGSWKNQYGAQAGNQNTPLTIAARSSGKTGGGQAHNNLQPYITVAYWRRTA